jgi:hypothetical protein
MYAFKRKANEEKKFLHSKFSFPILAQSFYNMVRCYGRVTKSLLIVQLDLKIG